MEENKTPNESMSPIPPPPSGEEHHHYHDDSYRSHYEHDSRYGARVSMDDSGLPHYGQEYPYQTQTLKRSGSHGSLSRRSLDDSNFVDARVQKLIQTESAIREEMFRDCTFRPKIKGLPTAYGPMKEFGTPFITRSEKWAREKEQQKQLKKKLVEQSRVKDCTFKPQISRNSALAIKEVRGDSPPEKANDRLYASYKLMLEQKERMREDHAINEERIEELECTFHPILETRENPAYQHVGPKFSQQGVVERKQSERKSLEEKYYKDFTFTPKVNKVKRNMNHANSYLSKNVVDRLTEHTRKSESGKESMPVFDESFNENAGQGNPNRLVMDAATFIGSLQPGASPSASLEGTGRGKSADDQSQATKKVDSEEAEKFYQRQMEVLAKREQHKKQVERALTPNFKPKISRKSSQIAANANVPEFLARVDRDVERRKASEQGNEGNPDPEATFKPTINKRASSQRSRSSFELSRGDLMKKETNRRMLQLQLEQEEMEKMTFKPQISNRAREYGRSALKVNEDPSEFLRWTKERQEEKERKRQEEIRRREEAEAQQCTFKPKTSSCPAYITRIAESMKNFKAVRSSASVISEKNKPDWR